MNLENERPTLREILNNISNKKDFSSKFIDKKHKEYFLNNYSSINIFKGNFNEVAIITKMNKDLLIYCVTNKDLNFLKILNINLQVLEKINFQRNI